MSEHAPIPDGMPISAEGSEEGEKLAEAFRAIREELARTDDPSEMAAAVTLVGEFVMTRLGFPPEGDAAVKISIGDLDPEKMSITITWPLS